MLTCTFFARIKFMRQVVCKFGGTSVSSRQTWESIATIIKKHIANNSQPIIVCSALSKASDNLEKAIKAALVNQHQSLEATLRQDYLKLTTALQLSKEIIAHEFEQLQQWLTGIALLKEASPKTQAQILSLGEIMITRLGQAFLAQQGINCLWFDVREALISTPMPSECPENYLAARCISQANPPLSNRFLASSAQAVITQGFIAANPQGETVLLGRGGSDTSAALLAVVLEASTCEIWTDVPGIYTANPHLLPSARLLKQLNYDEAQEIASMGAKVLHPNCLPPVRKACIPMTVRCTQLPEHSGTLISQKSDNRLSLIKSIQIKSNVMLISLDTLHMWQQVGFLADIFNTFKKHNFSVDLLSSSEFNVTLSLDKNTKLPSTNALEALLTELNCFARAKLIESCSAVSLIGYPIRAVLPRLGPAFEVFEAQQIHLMSLAANDLNLTFVVDESQAEKLCQKLHALLIENSPQSFYYSKSWQEEFGNLVTIEKPWWEERREELLSIASERSPCYVYNIPQLNKKADELLGLKSIDQLYYAVKANPHPAILKTLYNKQINFECVSIQELQHVLKYLPEINRKKLLFTPNFAAKEEYEVAFSLGVEVTIDSLYPLENWPKLFKDKTIILRIDPGLGAGHHKYVCTGGNESKFGIPQTDLQELLALLATNRIKVRGLHAHSGSGILTPELWQQTANLLMALGEYFPKARVLNLGGGLGIADKPGQQAFNLASLDKALLAIKSPISPRQFWLEPGRFFVAECGVILAKVTQCKQKGQVNFIGIETGMNSLIRPSLYGAYHEIVNLTRLYEEKKAVVNIVGPICESGDTLGYERPFPETQENDVVLIANTGAYGHCMSSSYNLRSPAEEIVMD